MYWCHLELILRYGELIECRGSLSGPFGLELRAVCNLKLLSCILSILSIVVCLEHWCMGKTRKQVFTNAARTHSKYACRYTCTVPSGSDTCACDSRDTNSHLQCSKIRMSKAGMLFCIIIRLISSPSLWLLFHSTFSANCWRYWLMFNEQWVPREVSGSITHATYSCDSQSIYVSFEDGSVDVLTASTLRLRCRINPSSYLPPVPKWA